MWRLVKVIDRNTNRQTNRKEDRQKEKKDYQTFGDGGALCCMTFDKLLRLKINCRVKRLPLHVFNAVRKKNRLKKSRGA